MLSSVGFDNDSFPYIETQQAREIRQLRIGDSEMSYEFRTDQRFCTGWFDFETRTSHVCPNQNTVGLKYQNCPHCMQKTGFNPAFYHATSVSAQQQAINQKPHFVYLAYFSNEIIKVGLSQEVRGIRRLLEQGARLALQLETFPSALIARQYEEKIARMPGFTESVPTSKKIKLLTRPFDHKFAIEQLNLAKQRIENELAIKFAASKIVETEKYYHIDKFNTENITIIDQKNYLIGKPLAVLGSIVICSLKDQTLAYDLKKYVGFKAKPATDEINLQLPSQQMTLF